MHSSNNDSRKFVNLIVNLGFKRHLFGAQHKVGTQVCGVVICLNWRLLDVCFNYISGVPSTCKADSHSVLKRRQHTIDEKQ